jgi:hypothetical protein
VGYVQGYDVLQQVASEGGLEGAQEDMLHSTGLSQVWRHEDVWTYARHG